MLSDTEKFYEKLECFSDFHEFPNLKWYAPLPLDWYVVITDVLGSTKAIENGRYKDVNALGAASIIALLNAVKPIQIPFVFGGDGATLCIPKSKVTKVKQALVATKIMAQKSFGLELRIGMVPMQDLREAEKIIYVGKYQPHEHYTQTMFLGTGLDYAESLVKQKIEHNPYLIDVNSVEPEADFKGFECRWNEIPSPHEETLTLLIQVVDDENKESLYTQITKKIIEIYGDAEVHHPLREENLKLNMSRKELVSETGVLASNVSKLQRYLYTMKVMIKIFLGQYLMSKKIKTDSTDWGAYKHHLIANTDYRKFDSVLRMVISGNTKQRQLLKAVLEKYREDIKIVYGMHVSSNALITCLVSDYDKNHVHFLDGANGGYALAAKEMKLQLQSLSAV